MFEHCSMVILGHDGTPVVSNSTAFARRKKGYFIKNPNLAKRKVVLKSAPSYEHKRKLM